MTDSDASSTLGPLVFEALALSSDALLVLTREGVVVTANPAAQSAAGETPLVGQSLVEVVDTLSREQLHEAIERAVASRTPSAVEVTFGRAGALQLVVNATEHRGTLHLVAIGRAVALAPSVEQRLGELNRRYDEKVRELASLTGKLRELATTDPLTNLFNRRAFMDRAEVEWVRAARHGHPLSCLIIDIDHFKKINDRYGHGAGDDVLRLVGSLLRTTVRASDLPARLGGEEFVALLPHTGESGAALLADRIRARVADYCARLPSGEELRVTCSAGVACNEGGSQSFAELLSAADAALYQAKARGRDCVVEATSLRAQLAS